MGEEGQIQYNHTIIIGTRERGGQCNSSVDSFHSVSDGEKVFHFVIIPHSFNEAHSLVARNLRGPALVLVREVVLHKVPDWASDDGDGMTLWDAEKTLIFVNLYTTAEELTCK